MILLAMDRASVRSFDRDGRLHIETSAISKANVCPYMGREIPGWQQLGLDGNRVYRMLRHPEELAKAAASFNNLPVLSHHVPVSAAEHRHDLVVGTTGSHAAFDGTYLRNSLAIWEQGSIDLIASDQKRELSSAYHYRPDMTSGTYDGLRYDGVMRDIVGNHVALVTEGRAGPDVLVGDESMKTRTALMVSGALAALVRPKLAQDAKVDLGAPLDDISAANLAEKKDALADTVVELVTPLLAADQTIDKDLVLAAIGTVEDVKLASDELGDAKPAKRSGQRLENRTARTPDPDNDPSPAMDEAAVQRMIAEAEQRGADRAAERQVAIRTAERDVHPLVGDIQAMDSAEAVYKLALDSVGYKAADLDGTPVVTLKAMVAREVAAKAPARRVAQDAKPDLSQSTALFGDVRPLARV